MNKRTRIIIGGGAIAIAAAAGTGVALAGSGGDDDATDTPITGPALARATAAALDFTGEGRVTETEAGDEESAYEVEVTLDDGSQVDVQLDRDFKVVGSKHDSERGGVDDAND